MERLRWSLLLVLVAACGGTAAGPGGPGAPDPEQTLESELARLGGATDPATSVARSRVLRALGRQPEALVQLEVATDGARTALDWAGLSALWREVGDVYLEMGQPQQALDAFGKRLKTAVSLGAQTERAFALVDTAYAFALMGAMTRSDEALSEALLLAGEALRGDPDAMERVALTRERLNDPDGAAELLGAAAAAYQGRGDATGAARAAVLRAQLQARAGHPEALAGLDDAVARSLDPEPRARLARYRAEAAYRAHDPARCEEEARAAIDLADRRGLQHEQKIARVVLARCAGASGRLDVAIAAARDAALLTEEQRRHLTGEHARIEVGFEAFQIYRLLLGLQVRLTGVRRVADAFVTTEQARARAHLDAAARSQSNLAGPLGEISPLLLEDKAEAEERLRRLTRELASRPTEGAAERHKNALWALEDIVEEIQQSNPLLARLKLPRAATLEEVQQGLLDDDTLLVSYFVGDTQVVAIAVARGEARLAVVDATPEELALAVKRYRWISLLDPQGDPEELRQGAQDLHARLLGPFDALVRKHRRLIIVPHGNLASLPFEALMDRRGKYVIEEHDVAYTLSATLALEQARAHKPPAPGRLTFVGVGDPVYDWDAFKAGKKESGAPESRGGPTASGRSSRPIASDDRSGLALWTRARAMTGAATARSAGLDRLPATATEVRAIAKLLGGKHKLLLRDEATEENVKAGALGNARIVHIASHGLLEPHYQALALTLDPGSREDGFLLHGEIAELKLDADLVVLSACDTGTTQLRSAEPVAGLALALRQAGARRVVVSLWPVADQATADLMTEFYRPLADPNADFAAALSEAKRRMLAKGKHPFYWAPFILLGD